MGHQPGKVDSDSYTCQCQPVEADSTVTCMQTWQNAEQLGLYGKNTVGNTDYFIAAGDSGLITVGGTVGGMVIAG